MSTVQLEKPDAERRRAARRPPKPASPAVMAAVRRVCDAASVKTPANLARLLSARTGRRVSAPMVQQWLDGRRPVPDHYVPAMVGFSGGAVALWDLCPDDWHLLWPANIGAMGAPAVPESRLAGVPGGVAGM